MPSLYVSPRQLRVKNLIQTGLILPFKECPKYETCSCNVCPLDPAMATMEALPSEEKCSGVMRSTRERIAAKYKDLLPNGGLTYADIARDKRRANARRRWEGMSPEARAMQTAQFKQQIRPADGPNGGGVPNPTQNDSVNGGADKTGVAPPRNGCLPGMGDA